MLSIKNLQVKLEDGSTVLNDINLEIKQGEVHYLTGRNGSGKSSLLKVITGLTGFEIINGQILFKATEKEEVDLSDLSITERSSLGIFHINQVPPEVPGVSLRSFLRAIYNSNLDDNEKLPVFKFRKLLLETARKINYPEKLLDRNLNEGMSGGEKKKTEVLQMILLKPRLLMIDELDSGLDKDSIKNMFHGISKYLEETSNASAIVVSHYESIKKNLPPTHEHYIENGSFVSNN